MLFNSTRNKNIKVSAAEAITRGLAEDGGLFVPESFPAVSSAEISEMQNKSYKELAAEIIGKYLTDFTPEELEDAVKKAYSASKFGSEDTAPVVKLSEGKYVLELWHGPTCAFKDMALQILPHLLTKSVEKCGEKNKIAILVATSGDTGKAALEGFRDVDGTLISVFYPENGVSDIQKKQMVTQEGGNVFVSAVKGNFDDAQSGVKKIFTDSEYKKELALKGISLSSANSINFGRLVPQVVYYFYAYSRLLKNGEIKNGDKVNFVVPTGNFGNILAAYYAKKMGLPVGKLICASNENNVLTDFINTGVYNKVRPFRLTLSPSMDILISSNLERLLYTLTGSDEKVAEYMSSLEKEGKYTVSEEVFKAVSDEFYGGCCDDSETSETIGRVFEKYNYLSDTHTAVALAVYDRYVEETEDKTPTVIASTASPYKFAPGVYSAIGGETEGKDGFTLLNELSEKSGVEIPAPLSGLKDKEDIFKGVCEKTELKKALENILN